MMDKPSKIELIIDTTRSLLELRKHDRLANYHVRGVFADPREYNGERSMNSVYFDTPEFEDKVRIEMEDVGMEFVGYAVYGCAPEGMYVCGDELSFKTAARIAYLLNRFYSDPKISLDW